MDRSHWEALLRQWSRDVLASDEYVGLLPAEVLAAGWLGYPGATEAEIQQAEARLGTQLPPSYREFLKVSNGWRITSPFIERVWSTSEVAWFAERNQHWIDAYRSAEGMDRTVPDSQYFVYGEGQDPVLFRVEYLQTALEVSEEGDSAIYLLNPKVVTPDGEWEAWLLANWLPGAQRYRSFWEMMQAEHESFLRLES
ncbi:MAG TPA: SMI1/KNR4 family protein [Herpetosiphonaceae bacterium]